VAENIGYALRVAGVSRAERRARVVAVAGALGLTDFLDRKPGQLSGGQRQRVAMGRAMIREPRVFLYDEPLSNLDARLRVAMRVEIRRLHQRLGATTLFVTHDQVEAMTLADRIVVMNRGVVEQAGAPADVYGRPATAYVAGFIGSPGMNLLDAVAEPAAGALILPDGQRLAVDPARWPGLVAGPVTIGVRAESVQVGPDGLSGTVDFVEELGSARLVHATVGRAPVVIQTATGLRVSPGQALRLRIDSADLHLFDSATRRRLAEAAPAPVVAAPAARSAAVSA
jgi:sn-glycerol 3-phosphate transport system ATP-binding protein